MKCRARKVEITLLYAVGEGRNASVQREFRGGKCAPFPMFGPHPRVRLNGVARPLRKLCFGRGAPCVNLPKSGTSKMHNLHDGSRDGFTLVIPRPNFSFGEHVRNG
ncbi:hypothetical protein RB6684 [Rhodopirellula baltica SH 1]|uniref:Uncharacterized protein n=1 Tax=Rhodopirellula baltica (strain DSM 10527 / NCIMB 13988 / SH1) TaxID=243090 RepID=Q7UPW4_RHOBA|nr:hypothetical protein RB6684 [Rhodopirellula baltica SH 1]